MAAAEKRRQRRRRAPSYEVEAVYAPDSERMVKALLIALGCPDEEVMLALRGVERGSEAAEAEAS